MYQQVTKRRLLESGLALFEYSDIVFKGSKIRLTHGASSFLGNKFEHLSVTLLVVFV